MLLNSSFVFFLRRQHLFCSAFLIIFFPHLWASPARCILYFLSLFPRSVPHPHLWASPARCILYFLSLFPRSVPHPHLWASPARCFTLFPLPLIFHLCLSLEEPLHFSSPSLQPSLFFIFPIVFLSFHLSVSFQPFSSSLLLSDHFYPVCLSCDFHLLYTSFLLSSLPSSVYLSCDFHLLYTSFLLSSLPSSVYLSCDFHFFTHLFFYPVFLLLSISPVTFIFLHIFSSIQSSFNWRLEPNTLCDYRDYNDIALSHCL